MTHAYTDLIPQGTRPAVIPQGYTGDFRGFQQWEFEMMAVNDIKVGRTAKPLPEHIALARQRMKPLWD